MTGKRRAAIPTIMSAPAGVSAPTPDSLDPSDGYKISLSNGNLDYKQDGTVGHPGSFCSAGTTAFKTSGKYYVEWKSTYHNDGFGARFVLALSTVLTSVLEGNAIDYRNNSSLVNYRGLAIDIDAGKYWWRENDGSWSSGGDPELGTTPSGTFTAGASIRLFGMVFADYDSSYGLVESRGRANFGATAFQWTAPSGFDLWIA